MRELAAQFVAKQQIVKRNQHNPLRQTDDADEEKSTRLDAIEQKKHLQRIVGIAK